MVIVYVTLVLLLIVVSLDSVVLCVLSKINPKSGSLLRAVELFPFSLAELVTLLIYIHLRHIFLFNLSLEIVLNVSSSP